MSLEALRDAAHSHTAGDHVIARVSPGESVHLLAATAHRVVTWSAVHDHGRRLPGPPAGALLPAIDADLVRRALLDHVRDWPIWVTRMTTQGPGRTRCSPLPGLAASSARPATVQTGCRRADHHRLPPMGRPHRLGARLVVLLRPGHRSRPGRRRPRHS
jgi:hypothetical protein